MIRLILQKPDTYGAIASSLCIIHCLVTPLLFIAHTSAIGNQETSPIWWNNLSYIFLIISFFAVARSARNTSKFYMKPILWLSWSALFLLVINEKIQLTPLPEIITYIAALSLSVVHLYNLKYCQCTSTKCCNHHG